MENVPTKSSLDVDQRVVIRMQESIEFRNGRETVWQEEIDLGPRIDELNPTSCLVVNLVQRDTGRIVAGTTLYLFEDRLLRQGHYKLLLWPNDAEYPAKQEACKTDGIPNYANVAVEFQRLDVLEQDYEDGFIEPEVFQNKIHPDAISHMQRREAEVSGRMYVFVKLPRLAFPVQYEEYVVDHSFIDTEAEIGLDPVERYWKKYRKTVYDDPTDHEPSAPAYEYLMALPKLVHIVDWEDREEVEMISDVLLTWEPPSSWTCLELMAVEGPILSEDIDLIWAAGFSRSIYSIDAELLTLLHPCILEYFLKISKYQEFYPIAGSEEEEDPKQTKGAVNLLGEQTYLYGTELLGDFLVEKALELPSFAQLLFWQLKVRSKEISAEKETRDNVFARLLGILLHRLQKTPETAQLMQSLFKQEHLFKKIISLFKDSRLTRLARQQKVALLKEVSSDPTNGILSFTTLSLPYDINIKVTGTLPDKLVIFKSAGMPVKVSFVTTDISEHSIIVKVGEDLRQDTFILRILRLMDLIWKRNGLDLKVTPYRCISLSLTEGILEFIPSEPLSNIIAAYGGSILAYLSDTSMNPSLASLSSTFDLIDRSTSGSHWSPVVEKVPEAVLENYVKSCAGYCVFTYIFGVGDRHLDNLLLTRDGKIFHVDFSYLFGNDPKPFPPPMKLCKQMVEAMGGPTGQLFHRFKSLCFAAFSIIRRHARLLISFLGLSADATATKYVQDRLMLNLEELDALLALERLIDESMNALFPKVFETLHKWAQYWRH